MSVDAQHLIDRLTERARVELELFEKKCLRKRKGRWLVGEDARSSHFVAERADGMIWPPSLPFPLESRDALTLAHEHLEDIARQTAEDIATWASRVVLSDQRRQAVLCRHLLVEQWRWPASPTSAAVMAMHCIGAAVAGLPEIAERRPKPPEDVSAEAEGNNEELFEILHQEEFEPELAPMTRRRLNSFNLSLLLMAEREVQEGQLRAAVAIDATKHNHAMLSRWSRMGTVSNPRNSIPAEFTPGRLCLVRRDEAIQLTFTFDKDETPSEAMLKALKRMLGPEGVRHWIAVQVQLSENGRRGWFNFDIDQHMQTMGLTDRSRRDPERRRRYGDRVKDFTSLELAVQVDGQWARSPLLVYGGEYGSIAHDEHGESIEVLDGFKLSISPLIYSGVRDPETGRLGKSWIPGPVELARIDHHHYGPAIMLGQILLIRMRWDLQRDRGTECLSLSGASLLDIAGLELSSHDPGRAWKRLRRNLDKLIEIGLLERYTWRDGDPWDAEAICDLWPADWILDRAVRGVRAIETQPVEVPETGAALKAWRRAEGLSQAELAKQLGVSRKTIGRNEQSDTLSSKLRDQLQELMEMPD